MGYVMGEICGYYFKKVFNHDFTKKFDSDTTSPNIDVTAIHQII